MNDKKTRLNDLYDGYLQDRLSREEYEEFLLLLKESGGDALPEEQVMDDWTPSADILRRITGEREAFKRRRRIRMITIGSAAACFVLALAYFFFPGIGLNTAGPLVYQTKYGETREVHLPEGSIVLLNANTRLTWYPGWEEGRARRVKLEGEAYFDVSHRDGQPFRVESGNIRVEVLGTTFNVKNRRGLADVFLNSGKVNLEINGREEEHIAMEPGDRVSYDPDGGDIMMEKSSTLVRSASWVEGMLNFENRNLGEILESIEELYGLSFRIGDPSLKSKRLDLSLPYSDWNLIKKALEISLNVEFQEEGQAITVKSNLNQ